MRTKTINIYTFDELSDDVKEKVIQDMYDINVDYEWWDFIYDDAKSVGIEIEGFDLDRGSYCEIKPKWMCVDIARQIIKDHGECCETYKIAKRYINDLERLKGSWSHEADEVDKEFLQELEQEYLSILQREYEYLSSEDMIIETIQANEYEFLENGQIA